MALGCDFESKTFSVPVGDSPGYRDNHAATFGEGAGEAFLPCGHRKGWVTPDGLRCGACGAAVVGQCKPEEHDE